MDAAFEPFAPADERWGICVGTLGEDSNPALIVANAFGDFQRTPSFIERTFVEPRFVPPAEFRHIAPSALAGAAAAYNGSPGPPRFVWAG